MHKKAFMSLKDLMPIGIMLLVTVVGLSVGGQILSTIGAKQCGSGYSWNTSLDACVNSSGTPIGGANTFASNTTAGGLVGINTLASWLPTMALVLAAAVVIGTLIMSFAFGRQ